MRLDRFVFLAIVATASLGGAARIAGAQTRFGACTSPEIPAYRQVSLRSVYVPMPDGVRLAVDLMLRAICPAAPGFRR
jgi:hypothetical protein